ncbi:MAG TPA: cell division protein FtsA [Elusimicrobia bacterium]|nr:cell division protein FtsA [Elusimicrobiota bacterium]
MAKNDLIAGLDIGSGRVTCVLAEPNPDGQGVRVLSGAIEPCRGVQGGVVLNISEASRVVRRVVEKAEEEAHGKGMVQGVYLGVRGKHIEGLNNDGAYNIARTDKEITPEDVQAVIGNARAISISSDREILHTLPQSFSLDKQKGMPDPVGMEGSTLGVEAHIVTALSSHLNNLSKAVALAGFEVYHTFYNPIALGELIVMPDERELGCLLADIGGQSISLAVFHDKAVRFTKELPIGTDSITKDVAHALRTSTATAEKLKLEHGVAHPRLAGEDCEITYVGVDGRTQRTIKRSSMIQVILPRVEELFDLVRQEVEGSGYADIVQGGGIILAGGGSMLKGMTEAAEQVLSMQARLGLVHPDSVTADEKYFDPTFASALALTCFHRSSTFETAQRENGRRTDPSWLRAGRKFFRELF